jgi:3-isopropylmalate/(R)-2-methylmalate dehydratase small subunit
MKPINQHTGILAPLKRSNVDTDQIIPKQFLKSIARTGFGPSLFYDWRYLADGKTPDPAFELNRPEFKGASILVAGNNFGCGSSREHAVWAVEQDGYRVIIAPWMEQNGSRIPGFADIFKNNCSKNGILTIELSNKDVEKIFTAVADKPGITANIDLEQQSLTINSSPKLLFRFDIASAVKDRLIGGLDDIGTSLKHEAAITAFEAKHSAQISR